MELHRALRTIQSDRILIHQWRQYSLGRRSRNDRRQQGQQNFNTAKHYLLAHTGPQHPVVYRSTTFTAGRVVIDGNRTCHCMYEEIDWKSGGQYPEFRGEIIDFFTTLLENKISPAVVFDGNDYNHEKEEEKLRRRNK